MQKGAMCPYLYSHMALHTTLHTTHPLFLNLNNILCHYYVSLITVDITVYHFSLPFVNFFLYLIMMSQFSCDDKFS